MSWKTIAFKAGQVTGIGATSFIAFWLITHPYFEPRSWLRWGEIVGSIIAAGILAIDFLDLSPSED